MLYFSDGGHSNIGSHTFGRNHTIPSFSQNRNNSHFAGLSRPSIPVRPVGQGQPQLTNNRNIQWANGNVKLRT